MPTDWHIVHYGSRAHRRRRPDVHRDDRRVGDARISPGCTGLYNDAQEAAWKRIVDFVHANSATKFCLQLGHAGRKGATKLMWDGIDEPLPQGAGRSSRRRRCPTSRTARCRAR
jgi:anthraniloyl-CoA monooxygenase